jgi:hypothetical protein
MLKIVQTIKLRAEKPPRKQHIYFFSNASTNAKKIKELFLPTAQKFDYI